MLYICSIKSHIQKQSIMKNRTTTMSYAQFRREFVYAWDDPRAAHNEITAGLNSIFDCALETLSAEPTYRTLLSACWAEYKRRSNA